MPTHTCRRFTQAKLLKSAATPFLAARATLGQADSHSSGLQPLLEQLATSHHVCGITVTVIKKRRLDALYTATGCQPAMKLNAKSIFQAASVGKPVFAYSALQLVKQGKLDLDAPLMQYPCHKAT